jgi:hypothetical protein
LAATPDVARDLQRQIAAQRLDGAGIGIRGHSVLTITLADTLWKLLLSKLVKEGLEADNSDQVTRSAVIRTYLVIRTDLQMRVRLVLSCLWGL